MINTETQELPSAVEETQVETVAEPTMQEVISDQLSESPQLERDESGRFVRKPEVKEPEALAKVEKAPADALAMPEGLATPAQERFQALASTVKEVSSERDQLRDVVTGIVGMLDQHKIGQEDFQSLLAYGKAMKTGDIGTWTSMLRDQVRIYETATGQPFKAADPLADYPDLMQAVTEGQLNEQYALQLARGRSMEMGQQRQAQIQNQSQQAQQQSEQTINRAVDQVKQLCASWMAKDLDWPGKQEKLGDRASAIATRYPNNPELWGNMLTDYYETLQAQPAQPTQRAPGGFTPLRVAGGGANMDRKPTSMLEAIQQKLNTA